MKLGKLPHRQDKRTLKLTDYIAAGGLPTAPATLDLSGKVANWQMFANDRLGDCTCAAAGHMVELWTTLNGAAATLTDDEVIALYDIVNGGSDNGAVELDVLNAWRQQGLAGHKLHAFTQVDHTNQNLVMTAANLFAGVYIGAQMPLSAQQTIGELWTITNDGHDAGSWGGHAMNVVGYDAQGVTLVTWGKLQHATWAWWDAYVDEAWSLLTEDWDKTTYLGLDFAQLETDLTNLVQAA